MDHDPKLRRRMWLRPPGATGPTSTIWPRQHSRQHSRQQAAGSGKRRAASTAAPRPGQACPATSSTCRSCMAAWLGGMEVSLQPHYTRPQPVGCSFARTVGSTPHIGASLHRTQLEVGSIHALDGGRGTRAPACAAVHSAKVAHAISSRPPAPTTGPGSVSTSTAPTIAGYRRAVASVFFLVGQHVGARNESQGVSQGGGLVIAVTPSSRAVASSISCHLPPAPSSTGVMDPGSRQSLRSAPDTWYLTTVCAREFNVRACKQCARPAPPREPARASVEIGVHSGAITSVCPSARPHKLYESDSPRR